MAITISFGVDSGESPLLSAASKAAQENRPAKCENSQHCRFGNRCCRQVIIDADEGEFSAAGPGRLAAAVTAPVLTASLGSIQREDAGFVVGDEDAFSLEDGFRGGGGRSDGGADLSGAFQDGVFDCGGAGGRDDRGSRGAEDGLPRRSDAVKCLRARKDRRGAKSARALLAQTPHRRRVRRVCAGECL